MYTFLKNIFLFETFHIYKRKVKLGHKIYNNVENAFYKGNIRRCVLKTIFYDLIFFNKGII